MQGLKKGKIMNIKVSTVQTKEYENKVFYVGKVSIYEQGRYLWSLLSDNDRLNRNDAMEDAKDLRGDIYSQNKMKG